jgi:hypothetical protein
VQAIDSGLGTTRVRRPLSVGPRGTFALAINVERSKPAERLFALVWCSSLRINTCVGLCTALPRLAPPDARLEFRVAEEFHRVTVRTVWLRCRPGRLATTIPHPLLCNTCGPSARQTVHRHRIRFRVIRGSLPSRPPPRPARHTRLRDLRRILRFNPVLRTRLDLLRLLRPLRRLLPPILPRLGALCGTLFFQHLFFDFFFLCEFFAPGSRALHDDLVCHTHLVVIAAGTFAFVLARVWEHGDTVLCAIAQGHDRVFHVDAEILYDEPNGRLGYKNALNELGRCERRNERRVKCRGWKEIKKSLMYDDRALLAIAATVIGISKECEESNDVLSWLRLFETCELALDTDHGTAALLLHLFLHFSPENAFTPWTSSDIVGVSVLDVADIVVLVQDDSFQVFLHLLDSAWNLGEVDRLRPASLGRNRELVRFEAMPLAHGYVNRQGCFQTTTISRPWV